MYDHFRINFNLGANANKAELLSFASVIGRGVKEPLMIIANETVSICRFWFDLQIDPQVREEIIRDYGLTYTS